MPGNPCGLPILFFACPKKRNKRKGSPAAETAPFAKVRNRRGNNSLRSNSLPLHPIPRLAARLSANGPHRARIPLNETSRNPAGPPSVATESQGWGEKRTPTKTGNWIRTLPVMSSRPEGEISSISRFLLALLVEKTDAGSVCSKIYGMRPALGHIKAFRAQREISGVAKKGALASATISPDAIVPTLQRGNAVVAWMERSAIRDLYKNPRISQANQSLPGKAGLGQNGR